MKEQEAQLAAKYGMLKPNVSSVVQRRISRGVSNQRRSYPPPPPQLSGDILARLKMKFQRDEVQ